MGPEKITREMATIASNRKNPIIPLGEVIEFEDMIESYRVLCMVRVYVITEMK